MAQAFQFNVHLLLFQKASNILESYPQCHVLFFPIMLPTHPSFCGYQPLHLKMGVKLLWMVPVGIHYAGGSGPH